MSILILLGWVAVVGAVYVAVLHSIRMQRIRSRLAAEHRAAFDPAVAPVPDEHMPWLKRWLFLSGYRRPDATPLFVLFVLAALVIGFLMAWAIRTSSLVHTLLGWLYDLPGGVGGLIAPVLLITPWILGGYVALLPWLQVRAARRRRVREVEEDLPITLQILATLARAGLGFDAALIRVLESSDDDRVLPDEFHTFRGEILAGVPRVQAWRRLARRIDVPAMGIFVSAMVHAEQVGGGLSDVLEHQAHDVQGHRRERALVQAQALPVKLVFPLVLCFLWGIFVWTLGPAFYQFIQISDAVMRQSGG